jgi:hypothetical protein
VNGWGEGRASDWEGEERSWERCDGFGVKGMVRECERRGRYEEGGKRFL